MSIKYTKIELTNTVQARMSPKKYSATEFLVLQPCLWASQTLSVLNTGVCVYVCVSARVKRIKHAAWRGGTIENKHCTPTNHEGYGRTWCGSRKELYNISIINYATIWRWLPSRLYYKTAQTCKDAANCAGLTRLWPTVTHWVVVKHRVNADRFLQIICIYVKGKSLHTRRGQ